MQYRQLYHAKGNIKIAKTVEYDVVKGFEVVSWEVLFGTTLMGGPYSSLHSAIACAKYLYKHYENVRKELQAHVNKKFPADDVDDSDPEPTSGPTR